MIPLLCSFCLYYAYLGSFKYGKTNEMTPHLASFNNNACLCTSLFKNNRVSYLCCMTLTLNPPQFMLLYVILYRLSLFFFGFAS